MKGGKFMEEKQPVVLAEKSINTHFTLAVIAVIVSCFTGFWTIPLALASLILSIRTQDLLHSSRLSLAGQSAWWAGFFGWLTLAIAIVPLLLILFFGGAMLAFLATLLQMAFA